MRLEKNSSALNNQDVSHDAVEVVRGVLPTDKEARDIEQSKDDCSILVGLKIRFL